MPLQRPANRGTGLGIPDSNSHISGSRDDVPPIRRVSNGCHTVSVTLEWAADCSTSLNIPDTYRLVSGSSDNVVPVWGTADGIDRLCVSNPLQWWHWP